ncbi:hypothetical protein F3D69_10765 [Bacteroides ovatus]|uniref:Carboxypeptidase-like regulatory domain-containing protein n=1 Tax=Bacteroides ovatus TaxID=28116 RepID=A0A5M5DY20_BACOV|nr:hypothetical protein F3F37_09900 [Bacteroides ovatus]RGN62210.1 hypothetical protein DXB58_08755 [Bacteroides sp. OM05-10AA]RGQ66530.1 hypothetical protein DWY87_10395 [Bacteroides sp. AF27-33]RGQ95787.1 hypothetical protein DWY71_18090 [Bacteroides sp. AF26-7BH]RGY30322.1 hypothetical protein DXA46_21450 [Bacteroides sp. OF02-3LB]
MLCLFSFIPKGTANNYIMNPYTHQEISADSIIERVMTFAPLYETIVSDYRANLYIKGKMDIQKKNFILRYVPSMFRLQKGVREYLLETYSDLHYTAPNIYDQKVKASQGTVRGNRGLPGLLEYFNVNIYSSSLLNDERLLSPLAKNGQKYYKYRIDSVMGDPNNLDYRVRFIPRTKSDQLVGGYMVVSSNVWSVREIRFSGRSELITFTCWIKMGDVGKKNEFLPVRYEVEALFKFLGNKVDGNYTASLDYKSIELKEKKVRKKEKKNYNLSESFSLQCDTNAYKTDASTFAIMRPIPLSESEKKLYSDNLLRRDTTTVQKQSKSQAFWGTMGDLMVEDYKFNLSNIGSVRFSPFINPLLFSYSGSNGLSYRQDFRYNRLFRGDKLLRIVPKLGYNFTRKEFYWSLNADFEYWPQKRGFFRLNVGNGNRIYSSKVLDELKAMPDSIFNFDLIHLDYFKDLYFNFRHTVEVVNGLDIGLGFSAHKRTAVEPSRFVITGDYPMPPPEFMDKFKNTYISFAPRIRIEWTPGLYYYMNGKRKINLHSLYPTFSVDYERGIKGVFKSTGEYERIEFDLQHQIRMGLMRNIYYRFGFGAFTNQDELYFVDFANFSRHNLPMGWNDEIGGVFQVLDSRWYNSSRRYVRGHFTYEAPFLILRHLMKYTRYVQNERIYISALSMPHLQPYLEVGYGIGTHIFDVGVFVSSENWKFGGIGCKFTFELFNR